jgi:hypothetical protein
VSTITFLLKKTSAVWAIKLLDLLLDLTILVVLGSSSTLHPGLWPLINIYQTQSDTFFLQIFLPEKSGYLLSARFGCRGCTVQQWISFFTVEPRAFHSVLAILLFLPIQLSLQCRQKEYLMSTSSQEYSNETEEECLLFIKLRCLSVRLKPF